MSNRKPRVQVCQICHKTVPEFLALPAEAIRPAVVEEIVGEHPDWSNDGWICREDLRRYRTKRIEAVLESERGELSSLELEVVDALSRHETLAEDIEASFERDKTFGEVLADRLATFGGSWKFLGIFAIVMLSWIVLNVAALLRRPFDPYPFILLNLLLSMLAAIQAPVIMMSQNRQEAKDRLRALQDYRVNLKAELEIRQLHEKLDHLLSRQWQRLVEIQQMQIDLLDELSHRSRPKPDRPPGSPSETIS